jgi:phage shock protein PspC (stress-responsive transcriptional regulator)
MDERQRLYRSTTDRKIAGVCGGLADYFDTDPVLVRGIFVALAVAGGLGFVLYAVLWIAVPNHPREVDQQEMSATAGSGPVGPSAA